MKFLFHSTLAILTSMVICACSGEDSLDDNRTPVQQEEVNTDGSWSVDVEGDMTRGLSLSGTTLTPTFNNENIYVYYGNTKVGTLRPNATGSGNKLLIGRLDNADYTVGQNLSLFFLKDKGFSTYTGQKGTIADIAANFDYATATAQITKIDTKTHTLTINTASFAGQQAIIGFKFSYALSQGDVITIGGAQSSVIVTTQSAIAAKSGVVYVALPLTNSNSTRTYSFSIKHSSINGYYTGTLALGSSKQMMNGKYYSTQTVTIRRPMATVVSGDKGKVIGQDGGIYDNATAATNNGTTSTGVIVYVGSGTGNSSYTHGLVLSLTNPSSKVTWNNRDNTATTPTAPSGTSGWIIPSYDQWNTIVKSLKGGSGLTSSANNTYANISPGGGAANLSLNNYWSTTTVGTSDKRNYRADKGCYADQGTGTDSKYANYVRRIYAF